MENESYQQDICLYMREVPRSLEVREVNSGKASVVRLATIFNRWPAATVATRPLRAIKVGPVIDNYAGSSKFVCLYASIVLP
jgi:hypothetical protein